MERSIRCIAVRSYSAPLACLVSASGAGLLRRVHACTPRHFSSTSRRPNSRPPLPPPYKILFCGTDDFASTVLQRLIAATHLHSELHVLVPAPAARASRAKRRVEEAPVKLLAMEHALPLRTVPPEGISAFEPPASLRDRSALLLTASFGHLLPPSLLDQFPPKQQLNLHPSLLPRMRGAAPIQWAIARGEEVTGVSVQEVGAEFDTGRVLSQKEMDIPPGSTFDSLSAELAGRGAELLVKVLGDLPRYSESAWAQADAPAHLKASKAPKLKRDYSAIKWSWGAEKIDARHRGFGYLHPLHTNLVTPDGTGAPVVVNLLALSLLPHLQLHELDSQAANTLADTEPGSALYSRKIEALVVKCADAGEEHGYLLVGRLQSAGKKAMSAKDWIRGYKERATPEGVMSFKEAR